MWWIKKFRFFSPLFSLRPLPLQSITAFLEDLHWLPVSQRVVFKTAVMVWKCVHGVAPAYLSDLGVAATAISGRQHPRSAATGTLLVPRARAATGQRSFAVNGPATWNRLPPALRSPDLSEIAVKRALKTHLFSTTQRHWDIFIILAPDINIKTCLLTFLPLLFNIWEMMLVWRKGNIKKAVSVLRFPMFIRYLTPFQRNSDVTVT